MKLTKYRQQNSEHAEFCFFPHNANSTCGYHMHNFNPDSTKFCASNTFYQLKAGFKPFLTSYNCRKTPTFNAHRTWKCCQIHQILQIFKWEEKKCPIFGFNFQLPTRVGNWNISDVQWTKKVTDQSTLHMPKVEFT